MTLTHSTTEDRLAASMKTLLDGKLKVQPDPLHVHQGPSESVRHLRHQRFCHGSGVCSRGFALNTNQSDDWSNCSLSTTLSLNSLHCHYCSLTKKKLQPWRCEVTSRNGGGEPRGRSKVEGLLSQHVGRSFALGFKEQRFSTKFEELRWIKSQTLNAVVHDTESPSSGVLPHLHL